MRLVLKSKNAQLVTDMKTNDLPFDEMADSMTNAAARMGIPLEVIREAKRNGSSAFRGGRVDLTQLREEIASAAKRPSTGGVLLSIAEAVAGIVAEKLLLCRDAKFRTDSDKMCQAVHNGFAVALCVVEPDSADEFLRKSSAMFERVFEKPARKRSRQRVNHPKKNGSEES
jgi:hypothetical protein